MYYVKQQDHFSMLSCFDRIYMTQWLEREALNILLGKGVQDIRAFKLCGNINGKGWF
jgi:hypothetical protein